MINACIDSAITIDSSAVPQPLLQLITAELSPRSPDKARAISEHIRGAEDWPDHLALWEARGHQIILPRGYVHRFEHLANSAGEEVRWENRMTLLPHSEHCFRDWAPFQLRDYQEPARDAMLDWAQGILQAPTGSGKTATTIEFARWAGQRTLVIVGKTSLARQWQDDLRDRYGYEAGFIGEGEWIEKDFTVALWQSIWLKADGRSSAEDFWSHWGCVVFDEVHHASASSLSELAGRFPAFYRIGLSATPKWDPGLFPIVEAIIGPVIYRVTEDEVGDRLITPQVKQIETDFAFEYVPTHYDGRKRVQNNYNEILSALVADPDRNDLIARIAREEAQNGHHVLIVTRRTQHVKQLISRLEKVLKIGVNLFALTGAQTGPMAMKIGEIIEKSPTGTVLISTVADEALDYPRLDRIIMAFPLRKLPLAEQQIGRIRRPAPGKVDAIVYDITDPLCGPLKSQRRDRSQLYARKGWKVTRIEKEELAA